MGEAIWLDTLVYIWLVCVESNGGGSLWCRVATRLRWVLFFRRCAGYIHRREVLVAPHVEGYRLVFVWYA